MSLDLSPFQKLLRQQEPTLPTHSAEEAAQLLLALDGARESLLDFIVFVMPHFILRPHHALIAEHLEAVERGDIRRLLISLPPRHSKTEMVSRKFPAWILGRNPDRHVMVVSYAEDFVTEEVGRPLRNTMIDPLYQNVFPNMRVARDAASVSHVRTHLDGSFRCVGAGGAVTGRGAHIAIIDDPLKDEEEANNPNIRDKVWRWYQAVLRTRLEPYEKAGGAVVIASTRWNDDDLTGRLLKEDEKGMGEGWVDLKLRALAGAQDPLGRAEDEALWEEKYPAEDLKRLRVRQPRVFSAMYQQEPVSDEGDYFKREWFTHYDDLPDLDSLNFYGSSDYATKGGEGDYTVHLVIGLDALDNIYLIDLWRKQSRTDEWIDAYCQLVLKYRPLKWAEERAQILRSVGPFLERKIRDTGAYCVREQYSVSRDKEIRARSIQARFAERKVFFPRHAAWVGELEWELSRFPRGGHDDQVDCLTLIGQMLREMISKKRNPVTDEPPLVQPVAHTFSELMGHQARRRKGFNSKLGVPVIAPEPSISELEELTAS